MYTLMSYAIALSMIPAGWYYPRVCSLAIGACSLVFLYLLRRKAAQMKDNLDNLPADKAAEMSHEERELLDAYPIYFAHLPDSINLARASMGLQLGTLPLAFIAAGVHGDYLSLIPCFVAFCIFGYSRPKLDPVKFLGVALKKLGGSLEDSEYAIRINDIARLTHKLMGIPLPENLQTEPVSPAFSEEKNAAQDNDSDMSDKDMREEEKNNTSQKPESKNDS